MNFSCSGRLERERKFYQGGECVRGKRKDRGGGGAKKILPARDHCSFGKLCSPTNGVSDWCSSTLLVNCLSITNQIILFCLCWTWWTLLKVVLLASILLSRNLLSFYVNLELRMNYERSKTTQFLLWYQNRSVGSATHWLWEKLNISGVGTHRTNNDGETIECGCHVSASKYHLRSVD